MKLAIASLLATSFFAGSAMADCSGMKSAEYKPMTTAKVEVAEEAVSTFDPVATPVFETETPAKVEEVKPVDAD